MILNRYDGYAISYGAGVNSTAMVIMLVGDGWRGPIVFADTSCEWPETYCYMEMFGRDWLRPRGLRVTTLGSEWRSSLSKAPLIDYCEYGHTGCGPTLPGIGFRWCTKDWKIRPMDRWLRANPAVTEYLIGIAADESHRRPEGVRPLVDRHIGREDCIRIIQDAGLSVPQKSGCYICPFQTVAQLRRLWDLHPELYERVQCIEESVIAQRGAIGKLLQGKRSLTELRLAFENQLPMFEDVDMDRMLRFQPCECSR